MSVTPCLKIKEEKNLNLIHISTSQHGFNFLVNVIGVININILTSTGHVLKFSRNKYRLALHVGKIDKNPDPAK